MFDETPIRISIRHMKNISLKLLLMTIIHDTHKRTEQLEKAYLARPDFNCKLNECLEWKRGDN